MHSATSEAARRKVPHLSAGQRPYLDGWHQARRRAVPGRCHPRCRHQHSEQVSSPLSWLIQRAVHALLSLFPLSCCLPSINRSIDAAHSFIHPSIHTTALLSQDHFALTGTERGKNSNSSSFACCPRTLSIDIQRDRVHHGSARFTREASRRPRSRPRMAKQRQVHADT